MENVKTFLIILILFFQPYVRQYELITAEEGNEKYLVSGRMAITDDKVMINVNGDAATFLIKKNEKPITSGKFTAYLIQKDTLINDTIRIYYRGSCIVRVDGRNSKTDRDYGSIRLEVCNPKYRRLVLYRFR